MRTGGNVARLLALVVLGMVALVIAASYMPRRDAETAALATPPRDLRSEPAHVATSIAAEPEVAAPEPRDPQAEMQRAIAKYPDLKVEGSELNREFVARVQRYRRERPQFFEQPEWPTTLADEAKANLSR